MDNLYLIGFAQSLFFIVLILTKKNKELSDYILSFFLLLLGSQLFIIYSFSTGLFATSPRIIIIDFYYWTLLGPTLLLYTRLITSDEWQFDWKYLFCLLPTLIVTIGFRKYIFADSSIFFTDTAAKNWFDSFAVYVWYYNSPVFYIITIIQLRKHSGRIKQYYSYSRNVDLKWLYFLSNGFAVFLFFLLFNSYLQRIFRFEIPSGNEYIWFVMVIYIFGIGFYGYKQKGIFSHIDNIHHPASTININDPGLETSGNMESKNEKASYIKSGLKKEEAEELSRNLVNLMENEKLYLDCELNLITLSKKLGTTNHKLSQVINGKFGKNFFDFVNEYRIEEVKNQLFSPDKSNYKIISIAYDCGFNSKSTFYTLFKNSTSLTPAEYRRQHYDQVN